MRLSTTFKILIEKIEKMKKSILPLRGGADGEPPEFYRGPYQENNLPSHQHRE